MKKIIKIGLLAGVLCVNVSACAGSSDDSLEEEEVLTTQEKVENTQEKIEDTHDRYQYAQRQVDRLKKAEDVGDYLDVVERIKIFD